VNIRKTEGENVKALRCSLFKERKEKYLKSNSLKNNTSSFKVFIVSFLNA
jgi:hypothetical protein